MSSVVALDEVIDSVTRLRTRLSKGRGAQVRTEGERMVVKATSQSWFQKHRISVKDLAGLGAFARADKSFVELLSLTEKHTTRSRYLTLLKGLKDDLVALRSEGVLAVPAAVSAPSFASLISDPTMLGILGRRWNETMACVAASAPLAATVMMGGLLEALLLARVNALPSQAPVFTAAAAPKDKQGKTRPLKDWGLNDYLNVAHELGWIRQPAKEIGQVLRDYRNYIHPEKERSLGLTIETKDAEMFLTVFSSLASQIIASK
jgi:hypothetical protein